jgi:peptidoglycan/xylan/chitin deacetylase (PgdA/CDA1 family)
MRMFLIGLVLVFGGFSNFFAVATNEKACNCVVFRLDDIQDNDLDQTQTALMDVFLDKNQKLSLGLIMHFVGNETDIVGKLKEGLNRGLFELAVHGWDHVDYTKLAESEQEDSLQRACEKMRDIFGITSNTFIPPYNDYNHATIQAINKTSFRIISSMVKSDAESEILNLLADKGTFDGPSSQIYHVPETASFEKWNGHDYPTRIPKDIILKNISTSITEYGYAVVTMHPSTFSKFDETNSSIDVVDKAQINELKEIIDYLVSKNIRIVDFSNMTGVS